MPELIGLTDTSAPLDTKIVRTVSAAVAALRSGLPSVTAAGPAGAINLWLGDSGRWHTNLNRYCETVEEVQHASRAAALRWFADALPKLGDFDQPAALTARTGGPAHG